MTDMVDQSPANGAFEPDAGSTGSDTPRDAEPLAPARGRGMRLIIQAIPLVAILVLGIELRLTFYQGVIYTDDLVYSHLARRMAEGISPFAKPLPDLYGAVRIGLYAPVALAYTDPRTDASMTAALPCTPFD